jgi:hypothetical protein
LGYTVAEKERKVKKVILWSLCFLLIAPSAFCEYSVGALSFHLPAEWQTKQEGMSFFSTAPDREFFISGMVFYGLPDLETARNGIMPLTRDMFSGFSIITEEQAAAYGDFPAVMITGRGYYKGIESIIHMLVVQADGHYPILQIFGSNSGWADNLSTVDNLYRSIQLSY